MFGVVAVLVLVLAGPPQPAGSGRRPRAVAIKDEPGEHVS
jgi:hypothetical protein